MIKKWKFISRQSLLDYPRMKIVEDSVELPDGKVTQYIREAPVDYSSVTIIAINHDGEILVQQLNIGEDIITAANRELSEESGYTAASSTNIGFYYVNNRRSNVKQHVVVCKDIKVQKLQQDDEEFIESRWLSRDAIHSLTKDGRIVNINMLAALQLFDAFDIT
jgi:8-oxo-dGTP pyrophosphatase MutT (NUDIX family)